MCLSVFGHLGCFKVFLIYKFIYLFLAALGLRCCVRAFLWLRRAGATLRCGARASHCGGFSCCGARPLGMRASLWLVGSRAQAP